MKKHQEKKNAWVKKTRSKDIVLNLYLSFLCNLQFCLTLTLTSVLSPYVKRFSLNFVCLTFPKMYQC